MVLKASLLGSTEQHKPVYGQHTGSADEESALLQQNSLHTSQLGGITEALGASTNAHNRPASEQVTPYSNGFY